VSNPVGGNGIVNFREMLRHQVIVINQFNGLKKKRIKDIIRRLNMDGIIETIQIIHYFKALLDYFPESYPVVWQRDIYDLMAREFDDPGQIRSVF